MAALQAKVLHPGTADGAVLWLDEPLSFWGGFDPATGIIVDNNHPQAGQSIQNTVLVLPGTRGSGGTPGGVAEAIRRGTGPAAIVMAATDANVMIGAAVAEKLYGLICPVLQLSGDAFASLRHAGHLDITPAGRITARAANA